MVAKSYSNIYLDLSFTLLFYRGSTVMEDIKYVIRSMKCKRMFWGTDYPDRPYGDTIHYTMQEFDKMELCEDEMSMILNDNVDEYLRKKNGTK